MWAVLVTGDLDFRPVVERLVQLGVIVELWYDPKVTAEELIVAADHRRPLKPRRRFRPLIRCRDGGAGVVLRVCQFFVEARSAAVRPR